MKKCNEIVSGLSYEQLNIWEVHNKYPDKPLFNVSYLFHVKSGFIYDYFTQAISLVVSRHGVFSSRFGGDAENAMQFGPSESEDKLSDFVYFFEKAESLQEARELIIMRSAVPFRLNLASPIRADVVPMDNDEFLVNITVHQIVCDCWSASLFFEEMSAYYNACVENKRTETPTAGPSFLHYSLWLQEPQQQTKVEKNKKYWVHYLENVESHLMLPQYEDVSDSTPFSGGYVFEHISEGMHNRICALAREEAVTPYVLYMTLFAVFLHKCTQQQDLTLSYPDANRNMPDSDDILGLFTRLLPLRFRFNKSNSLKELAAWTYENFLDNAEHDLCFFPDVIKAAGIRDLDLPLSIYKVVFGQTGKINRGLDFKNASIDIIPLHSGLTKTDLLVMLDMHGNQPGVFIEYSCNLFSGKSILRLWQNFIQFIEMALEDNLEMQVGMISKSSNLLATSR
ncbi:hypothetical protein FS594_14115 [Rahnella aquatilis]|nr:hypothetical protein FS594_14115 [Rahnella aquatilis]